MLNLLLGFVDARTIDNLAHIGGLVTGLVMGFLFAPTRVPTLRSMWLRPGPTPGTSVPAFGNTGTLAIRGGGLVALGAAMLVLWIIGEGVWG